MAKIVQPSIQTLVSDVSREKKLYFCSDFHLGAPNPESSRKRELDIVAWFGEIEKDAGMIFVQGDIFEVWFEYKRVIPRGYSRFFAKLVDLKEKNIPIVFFVGNHDYCMYNYFYEEFDIPVYKTIQSFEWQGKSFVIGHGDGLGPRDFVFKMAKKWWSSTAFRVWVESIPSYIGWIMASVFVNKNHSGNNSEKTFFGIDEWILQWIIKYNSTNKNDFYIFGHRHVPIFIKYDNFTYVNLGEWIKERTFAEFDGKEMKYKFWDNIEKKCLIFDSVFTI